MSTVLPAMSTTPVDWAGQSVSWREFRWLARNFVGWPDDQSASAEEIHCGTGKSR